MENILVIGYGNPGRLDDGLGPAVAAVLTDLALPGVTVESSYQLDLEAAATVAEHDAVVFVDAAVAGPEPFYFRQLEADAAPVVGFSSHAAAPEALLALARDLFGADRPGFLLGIRGYEFDDFGEHLSQGAEINMAAAMQFLVPVLQQRALFNVAWVVRPPAESRWEEDEEE